MGALLASGDPMTYQAIRAMDMPDVEQLPPEQQLFVSEEALLDSLIARDLAGQTLTDEDYERIERSTFGDVRDASDPR